MTKLSKKFKDNVRKMVADRGAALLSSPDSARDTLGGFSYCFCHHEREIKIFVRALKAGAFDRLRLKRNAKRATSAFAKRLCDVEGMRSSLAVELAELLYDVLNGAKEEIIITPKAWRGRAGVLIERGNMNFARGYYYSYSKAIAQYTAALEIEPENLAALYNRGVARRKISRHLKHYSSMAIDHRIIFYNRMDAKQKNEYDEILAGHDDIQKNAIADFSAVLKIDPENINALMCRGDAYYCICDFDKAMAGYNAVLRIDPRNTEALMGQAAIYYNKDDINKAMAVYNAVLAIDPTNKAALKEISRLRDIIKSREDKARIKTEREETIAEYTAILKKDPKNIEILNKRGEEYRRNEEFDRAVADHSAVLEIDPENIEALCNRGLAHRDFDKAIADFNAVLKIDPKNIDALRHRGWAYYKEDEYYKAIDDFTAALEIDPKNTNVLTDRGVVYEKAWDFEEAIADYEAVLKIDPGNICAKTFLACI